MGQYPKTGYGVTRTKDHKKRKRGGKRKRKRERKREKDKEGRGTTFLHYQKDRYTTRDTKDALSKGVWRDLYVGCYHVHRWGEIGAEYITHNIRSGLSVTTNILSPFERKKYAP